MVLHSRLSNEWASHEWASSEWASNVWAQAVKQEKNNGSHPFRYLSGDGDVGRVAVEYTRAKRTMERRTLFCLLVVKLVVSTWLEISLFVCWASPLLAKLQ